MRKSLVLMMVLCVSMANARSKPSHHRRVSKHNITFMNDNGVLETDLGFGFEAPRSSGMTVWCPSLTIKYTFLQRCQLQLATEMINVTEGENVIYGIAALQPSLKVQLNGSRGFLPMFAITAGVIVPKAATPNVANAYWAPQLMLTATQSITKRLSFEYGAGVLWDADNFDRSYFGSLNVECAFKELILYADAYLMQNANSDLRIDLGINKVLSKNAQIDFSLGAGLTKASPAFFCGTSFYFSSKPKLKRKV